MTDRLATYRLQLRAAFPFDAAAAQVDYLGDLGVSHLYCSPSLQAAPGSAHGYDVVDPTRLSEDLGGAPAHARLRATLSRRSMGMLLDIVPNHVAAHPANAWWWDVLEKGERSVHAAHFDIDWESVLDSATRGRVMVCVLGDHVGRAVDRGELRVERRSDGRPVLRYHDQQAPLSAPSVAPLVAAAARASGSAVLAAAALMEQPWDEIARACEEDDGAAGALDAQVETLNADAPALIALLDAQHYRLARWRLGLRALNYRRFFDIMSLVALRVERPQTFAATHALVLDMIRAGDIDGVRVDHVDGLRDPAGYLRRLRDAAGEGAWIVVEDILAEDEELPGGWPVQGTTGYEFTALSTRLLVHPGGEAPLFALHGELGGQTDLDAAARDAKRQALRQTLAPDLERLTLVLARVCGARPRHRDHTRDELREALVELIAALTVYRTYVERGADASALDAQRMRSAVARARAARPGLDGELLDLVCTLVVSRAERDGDEAASELVERLQQLSAAAMAKGLEDTTFYRVTPLLALDEVGCAPLPFSASVDDLHRHNARVQQRHPQALLALSTHDTKRSADVRARLALLAEMPEQWAAQVRAWHGRNARHRRQGMPDAVMEHVLYQSMVGAWPVDRERMRACMEKAAREAKVHTSWIDQSPEYEQALGGFVDAVYGDAAFLAEVEEVVSALVVPGRVNALAALLLQLTAPGVPDVYQGDELWNLSLVDPDNRRPVDFAERARLLERSRTVSARDAWAIEADSGLPKLLLIRRALELRRRRPELFGAAGAYLPLPVSGARADHAVAFARGAEPGAVTVVPRWQLRLRGDWGDTAVALPEGTWQDQLTGATVPGGAVPVAELLRDFPVALLASP